MGAYDAGAPEDGLEQATGQPVMISDEVGKMGSVTLTNDRVLSVHQKFGSTGGSVLGAVVAEGLQARSETEAGGPR